MMIFCITICSKWWDLACKAYSTFQAYIPRIVQIRIEHNFYNYCLNIDNNYYYMNWLHASSSVVKIYQICWFSLLLQKDWENINPYNKNKNILSDFK